MISFLKLLCMVLLFQCSGVLAQRGSNTSKKLQECACNITIIPDHITRGSRECIMDMSRLLAVIERCKSVVCPIPTSPSGSCPPSLTPTKAPTDSLRTASPTASPTPLGITSNVISPSQTPSTEQEDNMLTASSTPSVSEIGESLSCEGAVRISTGVLSALLVAVTLGWVSTCVVLMRRRTKENNESKNTRKDDPPSSHNPVYDHLDTQPISSPQPVVKDTIPPIHSYETVELPSQTGNYNVISRTNKPHPLTMPPGSHDPEAYSTLETIEEEHMYHVLELNLLGTKGERITELDDHEYSVLGDKGQRSSGEEKDEEKSGKGQSSSEEDEKKSVN